MPQGCYSQIKIFYQRDDESVLEFQTRVNQWLKENKTSASNTDTALDEEGYIVMTITYTTV